MCSVVGFTLSYISFDFFSINFTVIDADKALPIAMVFGAIISGLLKYRFVLKKITSGSFEWIFYNNLAAPFILPKALIIIAFFLFIGGSVLGLIIGLFIIPLIIMQDKSPRLKD